MHGEALTPLASPSFLFVFKMLEMTVSSVPAVILGPPLAFFNLFNDLVVREAVDAEAQSRYSKFAACCKLQDRSWSCNVWPTPCGVGSMW